MAPAVEYQAWCWRCGRMHSLHVRNKESDAWLGQIVFECISASLVKLALLLAKASTELPSSADGLCQSAYACGCSPIAKFEPKGTRSYRG